MNGIYKGLTMNLILLGIGAVMLVPLIVYYVMTTFGKMDKLETKNDLEDVDYGC